MYAMKGITLMYVEDCTHTWVLYNCYNITTGIYDYVFCAVIMKSYTVKTVSKIKNFTVHAKMYLGRKLVFEDTKYILII